ncbi:hypothetical protein CQW23_02093 [Capsicum baccatum]|uniref:Uncharacterized protein n=1 Tax=Capsicum baccatum TaxID=33114 RepID=A0A2G2XQI3_CAPBA|nr:hypothetical protein CQW23_02093 [Capsicum baccatum]
MLIQNANLGLDKVVEVLVLLAKCKEGRQEMIKFGGLLEILIKFLKNGLSRAVQYALLTISLLCNYNERMCVLVVREGVFEIYVGLLEDDNEKKTLLFGRNLKGEVKTLPRHHQASKKGKIAMPLSLSCTDVQCSRATEEQHELKKVDVTVEATAEEHNITVDNPPTASKEEE